MDKHLGLGDLINSGHHQLDAVAPLALHQTQMLQCSLVGDLPVAGQGRRDHLRVKPLQV